MAIRPIIILHGYSDSSKSFVHKDYAKSDWLRAHGLEVVDIELGDYISMNDEVSLFDIGDAFQKALKITGIPQTRHSFDLVVHSTLRARSGTSVGKVIGVEPSGTTPR